MSKHTKGPWVHRKEGVCYSIDAHDKVGRAVVARTSGLHYDNESNARLIAAAPDMLAVLERLADVFGWAPEHPAIAIIAKARGES
jgi:hypothetical protein